VFIGLGKVFDGMDVTFLRREDWKNVSVPKVEVRKK
jgi:hypothetical protein